MPTRQEPADSIAYCGLVCALCRPDGGCDCRRSNDCGKHLSPQGCHQYDCCTRQGIEGCWECGDFSCGKDMHRKGKEKIRAFARCIREDGRDAFAGYLLRGLEQGLVYHREGTIFGDYDLDDEEAVLRLLRTGSAE